MLTVRPEYCYVRDVARTIDLYFDYTCPFAYLASTQVSARGIPVTWKPILLGGVFKALGTAQELSETLGPAKGAHNLEDMQRWARKYGVTLRMPAGHPLRSVEALRATLATKIDPNVIHGFYRAYWVDGRAPSARETIGDVVTAAGHDAEAVFAAIETPEIKNDLRARTDEAIAKGVFGVPTWIVGDELIWGQDRIEFVEAAARDGGKPGKTLDIYFDFSSPFAYLGCSQVAAVAARTKARVTWHAIVLGGLFKSLGQADVPLFTFPEPKQRHVGRDLERWAARWGVPYKFPTRFPMRTIEALRVFLALPEDRRDAYRDAVFRAYWAEDRDIGNPDVLAGCVGDAEVARAALEAAKSDAVKSALRAETETAAARGVFGAPTFVVEGRDLYWGQDRLGLVEEALAT
jgi:2-hydroxychromene-2-carboxylate isomerase